MNPRIRVMVEDNRELEEAPADDPEILGMWRKALRSYHDSRLEGLGPESALVLAYQAGLQVATTVVRTAGYRVKDTPKGHHRIAYEALIALSIPELSPLGRKLNVLRPARHNAIYDWEHARGAQHLGEVKDVIRQMVPLAHAWLRTQRPHLAAFLEAPEA